MKIKNFYGFIILIKNDQLGRYQQLSKSIIIARNKESFVAVKIKTNNSLNSFKIYFNHKFKKIFKKLLFFLIRLKCLKILV